MLRHIILLNILLFSLSVLYSQEYEKGQLLVEFRENIDLRSFTNKYSRFNNNNSQLKFSEALIPGMNYYLLHFDENINVDSFMTILSKDIIVKNIQLNHKVKLRSSVPNDPQFASQWQYINTGQGGGVLGMDLDADLAWDISTGGLTLAGDTIVVAVIDDGANINHPDLSANLWINHAEIPGNGIDDDANGYIDDYRGWNTNTNNDDVGGPTAGAHGTPVAGIIGASGNNALGVTGVNWKVKIMLIRNNFNTNESNVLSAYGFALNQRKKYNDTNGREGAFVVATNASWGVDNAFPAQAPIWCAFYDTLGKYGIINIASTTNNNVNVDIQGDLPTTCQSDYLITVTNLNRFGLRNGGYGPLNIDLGAFGDGVFTLNYNSYAAFGGTSAAAPHVTAAIALAYSAACGEFISLSRLYPNKAALLIKNAILNASVPTSSLNSLSLTGGRLNLFNSLLEFQNSCPLDSCFAPYGINSSVSDSSIFLNWSGGTDSICIKIKISGSSQWSDSIVTVNNSYHFTNLAKCKTYEIFINGFCNGLYGTPLILNLSTQGCCLYPSAITQNSNSDFSALISWNPVNTALSYQIRWRQYGQSAWNFINTSNNFYNFLNLNQCSYYELQIRTNCADSLSAYSNSFIFTTTGCSSCAQTAYCDMRAVSSDFDWIESFRFGSYFHRSGNNGGYHLYDNEFFAVSAGQTVDFAVQQGNDFLEAVRIWIDFNRDGDFNDSNEKVFEGMINFTDSVNGLINIPDNVLPAVSRMRVALQWNTYPTLCSQYQNGETEDYCIQFLPGTAVNEIDTNSEITLYPNPAASSFFIKGIPEKSFVRIFDTSGRNIMTLNNVFDNIIEIQLPDNIAPGLYFIEIYSDTNKYLLKLKWGI